MRQLPGISSHKSSRLSGKDALDFLPTPPWATRALCEKIALSKTDVVLEPACGKRDMAMALAEYCARVDYFDVHDYGVGAPVDDFTTTEAYEVDIDWVISNPPFKLAEQFIFKSLAICRRGVAMLVRTNFLEGEGRFHRLFKKLPPTRILQFAERVPMFVGRLNPAGSTQTAYMWLVWVRSKKGGGFRGSYQNRWAWRAPKPVEWIAPCRDRLEKPGDYDQYLTPLPLSERLPT